MVTVQELVNQDLDRVKPVHQLRLATSRDALIVVSLAEIPHSNLVEVVKASLFGQCVPRFLLSQTGDYDVADVDFEEIKVA